MAEGESDRPGRSARIRRVAGFVVGLLLLLAAVRAVAVQGPGAREAWSSVRSAGPALIAAALVLPAVNWLIISASFWLVMKRYLPPERPGGRPPELTLSEMARLIGAAWLLNYLPLRPGMIGRIAYHRAVHGITVADSVRGVAIGMACGLAAVVVVVFIAALVPPGSPAGTYAAALAAPAILLGGWAAVAALRRRQPAPTTSVVRAWLGSAWLPANLLLRYADMLVWILRYWVVFALIGRPVSIGAAVAATGAAQIVMCIPLVGNGLGLREWAVGLAAAALPPELAPGAALDTGLAADLVNRIAELCVAIPVGMISYLWLVPGRRVSATRPAERAACPSSPDPHAFAADPERRVL
jgi:hypothetical protein